jgi:hypothetical protein
MTVHEAYIHLQQGLQNIAAFVNTNVQLPELDYLWNQATDKFITLCIPNENKGKFANKQTVEKYDAVQASKDDVRVLEVINYTTTLTDFNHNGYAGKSIPLPANYRHLLLDDTVVKPLGCNESRRVGNRLINAEFKAEILNARYYKTHMKSPVSSLSNGTLYVYNTFNGIKQFDIENIVIDYLRKPTIVTYGVDGSATLEFPREVCFKIIQVALIYISIITEQNPNKIQNLNQIEEI